MAHYLQNTKHEVIALGDATNIVRDFQSVPDRLNLLGYRMPEIPSSNVHPSLRFAEHSIYRGEAVARVLDDLKRKGSAPDVICCHPAWGEALYIKDVFPDARLINYCEFFYHSKGQDFNFDPEFPEPPFAEWGLRTQNMTQLLSLDAMDAGVAPTAWQAARFPLEHQPKISVISEGVDTDTVKPDPSAVVTLNDGEAVLTPQDEVITFVGRALEPYRGFHVFMRALPELQRQRPQAHVLIVGGDEVSYGKPLQQGTHRQRALDEVGAKLNMSRVHFLGKIPYIDYLRVLQISSAHVYLTYPFVLSWSCMEAMSAGCVVIGSRTPPVEELITHGRNGLLVDFFSTEQLLTAIDRACTEKEEMSALRANARATVIEQYDQKAICLPRHVKYIEEGGGSPYSRS